MRRWIALVVAAAISLGDWRWLRRQGRSRRGFRVCLGT